MAVKRGVSSLLIEGDFFRSRIELRLADLWNGNAKDCYNTFVENRYRLLFLHISIYPTFTFLRF